MFPLASYDYDPDSPFAIGNFKAGIHGPKFPIMPTACEFIKGKLIILNDF